MRLSTAKSPFVVEKKDVENLKVGDIVKLGDMFGQNGISYFDVTIVEQTKDGYVSECGIEFKSEHVMKVLKNGQIER